MSAPEIPMLPDLNSGPRNFITTDQDHGGIALVICTLMATWVVMFFMLRVYMRATVSGPFGIDDWMCTIATAFGVIQVIVTVIAVSHGFGKKLELLTEAQIEAASKAIYAAQLLYVVTNALTKCTVSLLLARIVFLRERVYACYAVLVLSILWGLGAFIAEAVRCTGARPWEAVGHQCSNLYLGWQVITAFNIFIEICLLAVPLWIVWGLQTDFMRKFTVVAVFWLRAPVIVAAGIRIHFLGDTYGTAEPLFNGVIPLTLLNVEMHYGLMSSTFPTLKAFVKAFNTGWGNYEMSGVSSYGKRSTPKPSFVMQSLDRDRSRSKGSTPNNGTELSDFEKDFPGSRYGKNISHIRSTVGDAKRMFQHSEDSGDSQQMIIHQTVTTEVHYESDEAAAADARDFISSRGNDVEKR